MQRQLAILCVYAVLITLGIPWYWPADTSLVLLGLPAWVLVAIVVSFLASAFTAWLLLSRPWCITDEFDE